MKGEKKKGVVRLPFSLSGDAKIAVNPAWSKDKLSRLTGGGEKVVRLTGLATNRLR